MSQYTRVRARARVGKFKNSYAVPGLNKTEPRGSRGAGVRVFMQRLPLTMGEGVGWCRVSSAQWRRLAQLRCPWLL